jgi:trehalose 6-phosphate phosphatase
MSPLNLLHPKGLGELARYVAPQTLFAFDLDGTLAPIAVHAWEVKLDPALRASLKRLDDLANVCVLTGRSRQDALSILGMDLRLVIGNHGCEWPPEILSRNRNFIETSMAWRDRLRSELSDEPGVEIEYKGETLALHYSKARGTSALDRIEGAVKHLVPAPRVIGGKFVMNLLPMDAETKGKALVEAMTMVGATRALYFGDDLTDEEVFKLGKVDLFGVHIGRETWTAASYYLDDQSEVEGVLKSMEEMLETSSPELR